MVPSAPAPEDEKADFCADGQHEHGELFWAIAFYMRRVFSAECSIEMPAGTDYDNAAERGVEDAFVSALHDAAEEPYSDQDAGKAHPRSMYPTAR